MIASLGGWYEPARRLNRLAMKQYMSATRLLAGRKIGDPLARGIQLFPRCLSAYQAALLLVERGAGQDALVHVRTIYETTFWIGFLVNDPRKAEAHLRRKADNSRRQRFRAVLEAGSNVDDEVREAALEGMRTLGPKPKDGRDLEMAQIARLGDCTLEYLHYLDLSDTAAHASLASIFSHLSRDEHGAYDGHQYGPNAEAADKAVKLGSHAMFSALSHFQRLTSMPIDEAENLAINDMFNSLDIPPD